MDSNFSYRDTRAPNAEVPRASRVARAPERAMLAAGCTTVIGGPLHRGFVQSASAIVAIDPGRCRVSTLQQRSDIPEEQIWLDKQKSARTRRAYRLDVQHLMRTLSEGDRRAVSIASPVIQESTDGRTDRIRTWRQMASEPHHLIVRFRKGRSR
jgi:hypothetical protein